MYTPLVPLVMFGWIPVVMALFRILPPRRALVVAYVGGFLFLPNYAFDLPGLPEYSKTTAISLAVALAVFSARRS